MDRTQTMPAALLSSLVLAALVAPGQPAATLLPDALDAPAVTSVADAQRSAALAQEMASGGGHHGHGGHGTGTYRQVDAGREPVTPPEQPKENEHHHEPPGSRP